MLHQSLQRDELHIELQLPASLFKVGHISTPPFTPLSHGVCVPFVLILRRDYPKRFSLSESANSYSIEKGAQKIIL